MRRGSSVKEEKFRFLEHVADQLFEARGKTFEEALGNAALAMFSYIGSAKDGKSFILKEKGGSKEELVVFLLSSLLSESEARGIVLSRIDVLKYDEKKNEIEVRAHGEEKMPIHSVKGVTFHMLQVKEEKGEWKIRVLLDV